MFDLSPSGPGGSKPQTPKVAMRNVRLTETELAHPAGRELKQLLDHILLDLVIEHCEVEDLVRWTEANMEHSEDIPAISQLSWVLQTILTDKQIEPFEWAMLRSCIEKILPESPKAAPGVKPPLIAAFQPIPVVAGDEWVVVDTETSGLFAPIYAVEIAAQRMRGWKAEGKPFRILLNHDVELEPTAVATHGYTRDYLRRNGIHPNQAHDYFAEYANGLPMVSHNLAYDFNRVLEPEWARLRRQGICPAGFCTVMMSRRCLPEITSASLESLGNQFQLGAPKHQAASDVVITVRLLTEILAPRLGKAGINTFASAKEFSRRTPLASCRKLLAGEALPLPRKKRPTAKAKKFLAFVGLLTQDGLITQLEFEALQRWLENEGCESEEAAKVADLVEKILADGKVTSEELTMLKQELEKLLPV